MAKQTVKVDSATGLTPTQERACSLLATGTRASEVARELGVEEKTLFLWQRQKTFICYYNKQRSVIRDVAVQGLYGLVDDAIAAVRESLNSTNEQVKLKAATYIIDTLQNSEVGTTDIVEAVKAEASAPCDWMEIVDETEYKRKLGELGVKGGSYFGFNISKKAVSI